MTADLLSFTLSSKLAQGLYSKSESRLNGPHAMHMEKVVLASLGGDGGILIGGNWNDVYQLVLRKLLGWKRNIAYRQ